MQGSGIAISNRSKAWSNRATSTWLLRSFVLASTWNALRPTQELAWADVLLVLGIAASRRDIRLHAMRLLPWDFLGFLIVAVLLTEAVHAQDPLELHGVRLIVSLLATLIGVAILFVADSGPFGILRLFAWSGAVNACVALMSLSTTLAVGSFSIAPVGGRVLGLAGHPNHLGLACLLSAIAGVGAMSGRSGGRLGGVLPIVLCVVGVIASGSRAALFAGIFVTAVALVFRFIQSPGTIRVLVVVASLALSLSLAVVDSPFDRVLRTSERAASETVASDQGRRAALIDSLERFGDSPILGNGTGDLRSAHNLYLQIAASGGLILLLGMTPLVLKSLGALRSRFAIEIRFAGLGVVAWLFNGLFQNAIYDRYLFVLMGIALVGPTVARRTSRSQVQRHEVRTG